jgi:hypothetical protein
MRKITPGGRSRLHVAFACALAIAVAWSTTAAFAQEDDEDVPWDTKIMRRFLKDLGLKRSGDSDGIEYRERAPLVVPPGRDLPPPRSETAVTNNPAWPKDPDVAKRRQDAINTAAQRAKIKGANEAMIEEGRALRPDELRAPPGSGAPAAAAIPGTTVTPEEGARPLRPAELGQKKGLWDMLSAVGPDKPEYAPFNGEPPRTALTAPPPGYQTPSPGQPYGVTPEKFRPKAADQADRAVTSGR